MHVDRDVDREHERGEAAMSDAMVVLTEASLRHARAQEELRIARVRVNHLGPGVPLRLQVAATARLRAALAEADAAERAYEDAQDAPAPED
jgi:hypothetical protein